jgi:hypothetical protein
MWLYTFDKDDADVEDKAEMNYCREGLMSSGSHQELTVREMKPSRAP